MSDELDTDDGSLYHCVLELGIALTVLENRVHSARVECEGAVQALGDPGRGEVGVSVLAAIYVQCRSLTVGAAMKPVWDRIRPFADVLIDRMRADNARELKDEG